jgi:histidinol phosphatase-like PHP family hydrolase
MKIDLDCYRKYSEDNVLEAENVIEQAITIGLNGICFTEHDPMIPSWSLEAIKIPEGF